MGQVVSLQPHLWQWRSIACARGAEAAQIHGQAVPAAVCPSRVPHKAVLRECTGFPRLQRSQHFWSMVRVHASVRLWFPLPLSRAHHVQVRARSYTATGWSPFARPWPHPPSCSTFCLCSEHTHFIPYKMKFRQKEHCSLRPCVGKELTWKPHKVDIPPIRSLTQG